MVRFLPLFFSFFLCSNILFSQDTVSGISYNLLRFNSSTERNLHFRNIIEKIKPDVLITQEMIGQESVNNFLNNILKNNSCPACVPFNRYIDLIFLIRFLLSNPFAKFSGIVFRNSSLNFVKKFDITLSGSLKFVKS